jgi:hypothetical protein
MSAAVRLPYGMRDDGRLICVSEVAAGPTTDLLCPACFAGLEAVRGMSAQDYFTHPPADDCHGAVDTMLSLLAQQVVESAARDAERLAVEAAAIAAAEEAEAARRAAFYGVRDADLAGMDPVALRRAAARIFDRLIVKHVEGLGRTQAGAKYESEKNAAERRSGQWKQDILSAAKRYLGDAAADEWFYACPPGMTAAPGNAGYVSRDEMDRYWNSLRLFLIEAARTIESQAFQVAVSDQPVGEAALEVAWRRQVRARSGEPKREMAA